MKLLVDIGNSRIKWMAAESEAGAGAAFTYAAGELERQLDEAWQGLAPPQTVCLANVAGERVGSAVAGHVRAAWGIEPVFLGVARSHHDLVNGYEDIEQMGVDRWLALVAARTRYRTHLCVVDVGTAVTVDLVQADGRHLGGYIIPGSRLMQDLANRTSGIAVEIEDSDTLSPGRSTAECLRNGVQLAVSALIDRAVADFRARHDGECRCLVTGGGGAAVSRQLAQPNEYDPDLVLRGMAVVCGEGR